MFAEVIVDIASGETDKIYDYLCEENTLAGSRVRAPFGGKIVTGFVMKVKNSSDYPTDKLKKILPTEDELPALNPECLALAEKITKRYRVPKALTLRLFLPSEMRSGKVRELMKNYARLLYPLEELKISKSAKNQWGAAKELAENGKSDCARINSLFPGGIAGLEKKGYVEITREQILRDPYKTLENERVFHTLTPEQNAAVSTIETDARTVQL